MDVHLLDKALNCYGSSLLQQLETEHGDAAVIPVALRRKYSGIATLNKDFWSSEDKENGEFKAAVEKFIAKKADLLFESKRHKSVTKDVLEENPEDVYGILPPLESFMHVPPDLCHQHFYESLSVDDVVIGVVVSVMETGLVARLLCVDCPSMDRDIDELNITAFCPSKELPRMFTHQSVTEAYQPRDIVRGIVLSINPEKEKIILSLRDKSDLAEKEILPKIGLISKDDFPVHYRRKLQKNEMSFHQLLHSILGFTNKGSVDFLRSSLSLSNTSSLMRGLHGLKIPEEEYADKLRKWQAQKQAHWSVEQGVEMVKKGRQLEAIQHLNRALLLDPDNTEALVARGAVYANNECYPKAVEDFERALEADPKHSNARKYLLETRLAFGRSHEERDQLEDAEDDYKEALKLNPQSSEARDGLERVKHLQAKDKSKKGKHSPVIISSTSSSSDEGDKLLRATETLKRLIHADDKDNRKAKTKAGSRSRSRKKSRKHGRRKSRHRKSYTSSSSSSETDSSSNPNSEIQKKQKQHYTRCPVDDSPDSLESEQERKRNSRGKDRQLTSGPLHPEKIHIEGKRSSYFDLTSRPQKQQSRVKVKELSSDSSLSDASSRDRHSRSQSKRSRRRSQSQHVTTEGSTGWTSPKKSKGSNFSKSAYQSKLGKIKRHSSSSSDSSSHLGRQSSSSSSSSMSESSRSRSSDSSDERHTHHRRVSLETGSSERSSRSSKRSVWIEKTTHNKETQKHGAEKPRRLSSGSQNQPTRPSKDTKEEGMETCGSPHSMKSLEGEVKHPLRSQRENKIQKNIECGATSSHDGGASEVQDHHCQHNDEDTTLAYSRLVALQDGHNQKNDELAAKQTKALSMTGEDTESRYKTSLKEIVTKKGVPTVVSKWDSPVRRSRWDIAEQDKRRKGGIKVEEMDIMSLQENDVPSNPSLPVPQVSQSMVSKSLGDNNRINNEKKKQNTDLQDEGADSRARTGSDDAQVGPPDVEPQNLMNRRQSTVVPGQGDASTSEQNNVAGDKNERRLERQKPLPKVPSTVAHNSKKDSERGDKYSCRSLSREREPYGDWHSQTGKNIEESFTHKSAKYVYRSLSSSEGWRQSRSPSAESKSSSKKIQYTPSSERSSSRNRKQKEEKLSQQEEAMWVEKTKRNDAVWVEKTLSNKTKSDNKGKQRLHTLGVSASSIHDSDSKDSKAQQKSQKKGRKRKRSISDSSSASSSDTKKKARSSNKKFKRAKHLNVKKKHRSSSPVTKKVTMTSSRKSVEGTYKQDWNVDPSKLKIKQEPEVVGEQSSFKDEDSKKMKWTKEEDIQLNQLETFLKALKTKKI